MKKMLFGLLLAMSVGIMALPAFAQAEVSAQTERPFTIVVGVGEEALDLSGLPRQPYYQGEALMVPLAKIAQALGYQVSWNSETGAVVVEDAYTQRATLFHENPTVVFEGKLTIIDLSRQVEYVADPVGHQGCLYVPLEFFEEFFNVVEVDGAVISVAPMMAEIQYGV